MADRQRGMGRGLAAILSVDPEEVAGPELRRVPVAAIGPNPRQPRKRFDEQTLVALAESLKERGVLQPVLVRPIAEGRFELVAGERRWRAARLAGLDEIPAIVRDRGDAESLEIALVENMARENLNPMEEARACAALVEELGLTREGVGRRIGRSRVAVSNLLRLLDLPDEAIDLIEHGRLSEGHGRALLLAADHDHRRRLARDAAEHGWSVRETERRAREAGQDRAPRRRRGAEDASADARAAATAAADALARALGTEVAVTAHAGGLRAEVEFASLDEALELAHRLRAPRAA